MLLEDVLALVGLTEELLSDLLLTRLSPFLTLEKEASSILLLDLELLLDLKELLGALSEFSPIDDAWEGSVITFLLRLDLEV